MLETPLGPVFTGIWTLEGILRHLKPTASTAREKCSGLHKSVGLQPQRLPGEGKVRVHHFSSTRNPVRCTVGSFSTQVTPKNGTVTRKEAQWERKGKRSEKEQQVNWKQKYKWRRGNSGKVVSLLLAPSRDREVMSEK